MLPNGDLWTWNEDSGGNVQVMLIGFPRAAETISQ
jgi:hypothetical protein